MVISSRTPEGSPHLCPVCGSAVKIAPSDPAGDAPCPNCGHLLWFTWEDVGDVQIIKPTGNLFRPESLDVLIDNAVKTRGVRLVLDLGDVQFMSSAVLGKLINLKKRVEGVRGKLKIENIQPDLLEVFRITRLDQVFNIGP